MRSWNSVMMTNLYCRDLGLILRVTVAGAVPALGARHPRPHRGLIVRGAVRGGGRPLPPHGQLRPLTPLVPLLVWALAVLAGDTAPPQAGQTSHAAALCCQPCK